MRAQTPPSTSSETAAPLAGSAVHASAAPFAENFITSIVSLTDPREPLPELLRRCLGLVAASISATEPTCLIKIISLCLASARDSQSTEDWRRRVWAGSTDPQSNPIAATYVKFDTRYRVPFAETQAITAIFGRSLKLVWVAAQSGRCGYRILKPDYSEEWGEYGKNEVPGWLNAELGRADCAWSQVWGTHVPAAGSFHAGWSHVSGWK